MVREEIRSCSLFLAVTLSTLFCEGLASLDVHEGSVFAPDILRGITSFGKTFFTINNPALGSQHNVPAQEQDQLKRQHEQQQQQLMLQQRQQQQMQQQQQQQQQLQDQLARQEQMDEIQGIDRVQSIWQNPAAMGSEGPLPVLQAPLPNPYAPSAVNPPRQDFLTRKPNIEHRPAPQQMPQFSNMQQLQQQQQQQQQPSMQPQQQPMSMQPQPQQQQLPMQPQQQYWMPPIGDRSAVNQHVNNAPNHWGQQAPNAHQAAQLWAQQAKQQSQGMNQANIAPPIWSQQSAFDDTKPVTGLNQQNMAPPMWAPQMQNSDLAQAPNQVDQVNAAQQMWAQQAAQNNNQNRYPVQGAAYPVQGAAYPVQGAAYPVQGAEYPVQGAAYPGPGAPPYPGPGAPYPNQAMQYQNQMNQMNQMNNQVNQAYPNQGAPAYPGPGAPSNYNGQIIPTPIGSRARSRQSQPTNIGNSYAEHLQRFYGR